MQLASPIDEVPVEAFLGMPEWCVYVELPVRYPGIVGEVLRGFYAHLEHDINTGRAELRLLLDEDEGLTSAILHIGPWSVLEAITRMADESHAQAQRRGMAQRERSGEALIGLADVVTPLVSLLLYLCTDPADIVDPRKPGRKPRRTMPTKTRRGPRMLPPTRVTTWQVGETISHNLDATLPGGTWVFVDGRYRWISSAGIA